jgi:putative hemolysin
VRLALLVLLLGVSAIFSAAETALFSLRRGQLDRLRAHRSRGARSIVALLEHPARVLATVLVGNNTTNLVLSVAATGLFVDWFGEERGLVVATFGLTVLVLVFGEIAPKTVAVARPLAVALRLAPVLSVTEKVFLPATRGLDRLADATNRQFARRLRPREPAFSEDEIKTLVTMGWEQGLVGVREKDFIHNVFELDDRRVGEILTPRQRVFAIPVDARVADVRTDVRRAGFARVPTWAGSPENLVGYVDSVDLLWEHDTPDPRRVADLKRDLPFYPETKRVGEILSELRGTCEMAAVVDEHGDFAGIVTLEDAVEQVVGEIFDVHDLDRLRFTSLPGGEMLVLAQMEIAVFNELLGAHLRDSHSETVGGFVINRLGRIPGAGETLEIQGLRFTVEHAAPNRVIQLRVRRLDNAGTRR